MKSETTTKLDWLLAGICRNCPVCRSARNRPSSMAHRLVKRVEGGLCPFCRAYERVYGRKAHQRAADTMK